MSKRFAIGDIHGCLRTFEALLDKIQLSPNDQLFITGDYIDRGEHSKGVLDKLMQLWQDGYNCTFLLGNHEQLLLEAYQYESMKNLYPVGMAMQETLNSFDVDNAKFIPIEYIAFMKSMPRIVLLDDYILVHAGLNFSFDNPLEDEDAMIWKRRWYENINRKWLGKRIIIHGHTPQSHEATIEQLDDIEINAVLNIDCGAVYANPRRTNHLFGQLCAFELNSQTLFFQDNVEKNPY